MKNNFSFISFTFLLLIAISAQSQNKIINQVVDKSLVYGSILLQSSASLVELKSSEVQIVDDKDHVVGTTITSDNGKFMMKQIPIGKYYLKVKNSSNNFYPFKDNKPKEIKLPFEVKERRTNLSETIVYPLN